MFGQIALLVRNKKRWRERDGKPNMQVEVHLKGAEDETI